MDFENSQEVAEKRSQVEQLLEEEKWILEALERTNERKNTVQTERIRLETLRAEIKNKKYESLSEKYADISAAIESMIEYSVRTANSVDVSGPSASGHHLNVVDPFHFMLMPPIYPPPPIFCQPPAELDVDTEDFDSDDDYDDDSEELEVDMRMLTIDDKEDEVPNGQQPWYNSKKRSADCAFEDDSD